MELRRPEPLDLHGAIDGRLPVERQADLSKWLASHPEEAHRLGAWSRDMARLRAAYDPVLDEALPASLLPRGRVAADGLLASSAAKPEADMPSPPSGRPARRGMVAVAVGCFFLGGATALAGAALLTRLAPPQGGVAAAILQAVSNLLP